MTAQNRVTLYTYFETNDKPTQGQFQNLIDSSLNIADTASQSVVSNVNFTANIQVSGLSTFIHGIAVSGLSNFANGVQVSGNTIQNAAYEKLSSVVIDNGAGALTIGAGQVTTTMLTATAVTPGSYTNTNITVGADGRLTAAGNGSSSGVTSSIRLQTANGYGATATHVRRFTTVVASAGSDVTYADDANNGGTFTINTNGTYAISYNDQFTFVGTNSQMGISLNSNQLTTNIFSITQANILSAVTAFVSSMPFEASWVGRLSAADVVRAHTAGDVTGSVPNTCQFTIARVT